MKLPLLLLLLKPNLIFLGVILPISFGSLYAQTKKPEAGASFRKANVKEVTKTTSVEYKDGGEKKSEEELEGARYILNCSECHGFDGNSPGQKWPNIAGLNQQYIIRQLDDFRSGKRVNKEMAVIVREFPSNKELISLAKYFSRQLMVNKNTPDSIKSHEFVDLKIGEEIFIGKRVEYGIPACSACHGRDAMGDKSGKYPRLAGQNMDYIIRQMEFFRSKKRSNDTPPQMRNIAGQMDDEDIASVAAYIAYMKSE